MKKFLVLLTLLLVNASVAWGTQLTFGYADGNMFVSGAHLWDDELRPVPLDASAFQLNGATGGTNVLVDPVRLFIGVANVDSSYVAPAITSVLLYDAATNTFTATAPVPSPNTATYKNYLDGSDEHVKAYNILGLSGLNDSQNWTNWSGAYNDLIGPPNASSFSIFEYNLYDTNLEGGKIPVGVAFSDDLLIGTYIFGAAQFTNSSESKTQWYGTAFTETGMVVPPPVPEPSTMLLLGAGFLGLAAYGRKRIKK